MSHMNFPVHFSSQLREHLRALRKERGLTQAGLGQLLGVGQARIAEIENNPGVISVDQLMKVLSVLRASMVLHNDDGAASQVSGGSRSGASLAPNITRKPVPQLDVKTSADGQWRVQPKPGEGRHPPKSARAAASDVQKLQNAKQQTNVTPTFRIDFVIRPKKGSW